ncbi:hypothetical protein NEUTE1DRAFT_105632 [Neurospora tetrasperma FGSC 2508]|uniref:Uncharacterized protein n=1 Tax=Neurospora tetrasperma (strain FGSC 2508 / ATCC MYA-4615 / P0657) TaxID=510951 RepID=F8N409_NEUT8|nr:uncharacterized protein NEUTE1DRAFT_105632 [Neurospora tetrasperma FGSC 2508]EGO52656.1 hypothetical protein NEUTE1DRAFT_105632 [Neurospora tetrasperma FGSC 2508]
MWFQLQVGFPFGSKIWEYFGFGGKHGLAFEYDPIWEQEPEATDEYSRDHRLKLKENTPTDKREPSDNQKVFYGYDGRRYVEVYSKYVEGGGDRLPWFYTEGLKGEDSSFREGSCHSFIAVIEFGLTMEFLNELSENEWGDQEKHGPALGLLACLR